MTDEQVGELRDILRSEKAREKKKRRQRLAFEPEMVKIPGGSFLMGSPADEPERDDDEGPRHRVHVPSFELGKYEVTFSQWDACVADGGCGHKPDDKGWGRGNRPVIYVSWNDIQEYLKWLNGKTGKRYRLPTEAEWEYAARAGTTTPYIFGADPDKLCDWGNVADRDAKEVYDGWTIAECSDGYVYTAPVGRYKVNPWGLYDVHGNVWEWVADCWNGSYEGAPSDGSAWLTGDCARRVLRGGSWDDDPWFLRSAIRYRFTTEGRLGNSGFRLARTLTP